MGRGEAVSLTTVRPLLFPLWRGRCGGLGTDEQRERRFSNDHTVLSVGDRPKKQVQKVAVCEEATAIFHT